ncbi:hypothetical protein SAMN05444287_2486 [Octadecabacter temperatus]|jgi:hypothetical protein|uniref:Uncharacterized protein n=1 Tax=Octadecabacter temperatus TaxID=1458307 RepID=A0A0K0Y0X9_9RHOB|nr:hypothetical protein OSB_00340 [Octadecabacter temperatus]SIO37586.1 hypothetical protein SAMN05444287_2486 [Octadecabacter temperatus]
MKSHIPDIVEPHIQAQYIEGLLLDLLLILVLQQQPLEGLRNQYDGKT